MNDLAFFWGVLIVLGAVALTACASALWAAMWHSDEKFEDVDHHAEARRLNERLARGERV